MQVDSVHTASGAAATGNETARPTPVRRRLARPSTPFGCDLAYVAGDASGTDALDVAADAVGATTTITNNIASSTDTDATSNPDSENSASEVHFAARGYDNGLSFSSVAIGFFGPVTLVTTLDEAIRLTRHPGEPRWPAM